MKIISYNLNGIRAATKLGVIEWLIEEDADVVCLQEVRASEEICQDIFKPLDGYYIIYNCGTRKGYSGTVTLLKKKPDEISFGVDSLEDKDVEGRTIVTRIGDYVIVNSYVPNGSTRFEYKKAYFRKLKILLANLKNDYKKVILCSDTNIAHREIDVNKPKVQGKKSGFLLEERQWLDDLLALGFIDAFRELNKDTIQYTWRSYRARDKSNDFGWRFRFDYVICDLELRAKLYKCYSKELVFSDHLPVILEINN